MRENFPYLDFHASELIQIAESKSIKYTDSIFVDAANPVSRNLR